MINEMKQETEDRLKRLEKLFSDTEADYLVLKSKTDEIDEMRGNIFYQISELKKELKG